MLGWSGGIVDPNLPEPTLYSNAGSMSKVVTFTPAHYKIRLLVSLWFTNPTASSSDWIKIDFTYTTVPYSVPFIIDQTSYADFTGINYKLYPVGWRAKNVDLSFYDSYRDSSTILFTSSKSGFGIR